MQQTTEYQNNAEGFTAKEILAWSISGLLVVGGCFFVGRSLIRKARSNNEEKKTFDESTPASYAQKLKLAFENDTWFGWGTDEDAVRNVMVSIPSKDEFKKIIASYQKLYASSLMMDLKQELTTTEYNEMLAIISSKPEKTDYKAVPVIGQPQYQAWAKRLKAAFDITYWFIPGTDEPAIKAVFNEIPTQAHFLQVGLAYKKLYNSDLITDLKSELEFWEYGSYMDIINKKPKQ